MMSIAASSCSFSPRPSLNFSEPLRAMTPRLLSSSSFVMPMPLSDTVIVRASLSGVTRILKSLRAMPTFSSVSDW